MIQVNLLPPEYRKSEGTPLPRFLAIVGGVVLCTGAIGLFLYVHFGTLMKYTSIREQKEDTYYKQKVLADRSLALQREFNEYQKRQKTIEAVSNQRILLSKKIDEICDIIHNNGDRKKHFIWLTHLSASVGGNSSRRKKGSKSGGEMKFKGFSATADFSRLADFREQIEQSAENDGFFADFASIDYPAWTITEFDDGLEPNEAGTFNHTLVLKPLGWRLKAKKKRK
jgi:hypothetical protein